MLVVDTLIECEIGLDKFCVNSLVKMLTLGDERNIKIKVENNDEVTLIN